MRSRIATNRHPFRLPRIPAVRYSRLIGSSCHASAPHSILPRVLLKITNRQAIGSNALAGGRTFAAMRCASSRRESGACYPQQACTHACSHAMSKRLGRPMQVSEGCRRPRKRIRRQSLVGHLVGSEHLQWGAPWPVSEGQGAFSWIGPAWRRHRNWKWWGSWKLSV